MSQIAIGESYRQPTQKELESSEFDGIWKIIKELNNRTTGRHAAAILDVVNNSRREEYRKDVCYITEIIRSLRTSGPDNLRYSYSNESTVPKAEIVVDRDTKYGTLLLDWQKELMEKAGFETMDELKDYFFEHVGEENW